MANSQEGKKLGWTSEDTEDSEKKKAQLSARHRGRHVGGEINTTSHVTICRSTEMS